MRPKTDETGKTIAILTTTDRKRLAAAIDVVMQIDICEGGESALLNGLRRVLSAHQAPVQAKA